MSRQTSGWLLLALFAFQLTTGALHRQALHCDFHMDHGPGQAPFQVIAGHTDHSCAGPTHDPDHCTICGHILKSASALLSLFPDLTGFKAHSIFSVPVSTPSSVSPVEEQRQRAPPSPFFF